MKDYASIIDTDYMQLFYVLGPSCQFNLTFFLGQKQHLILLFEHLPSFFNFKQTIHVPFVVKLLNEKKINNTNSPGT